MFYSKLSFDEHLKSVFQKQLKQLVYFQSFKVFSLEHA